MKESTDRYDHIIQQLEKQKIKNYSIIEAVNGHNLNETYKCDINSKRSSLYKFNCEPLTKGQIGCFLSHKKIYETFINSNYQYSIILEDDVVFETSVQCILKDLIDLITLDSNFDYLKLENRIFIPNGYISDTTGQYNFMKNWYTNPKNFENISPNFKRIYTFFGTGAQILSKKGASKLVKFCSTIYEPIDIQLSMSTEDLTFQHDKIVAYATNTNHFSHKNFGSLTTCIV